jgi:hypothetical protein
MSDITMGIYIGGVVSFLLVLATYLKHQNEVRMEIRSKKRTIVFNMSNHDEDNDSIDTKDTPVLTPKTSGTKGHAVQDSKKSPQGKPIGKSKA